MHCVLNYPTEERNANLGRIIGLRKAFPDLMIGYSDHTMPADMKALEIAMFMGAVILEKHFTHDKSLPGNDHYHAMDKEDLKNFIKLVERDLILYGREDVKSFDSETPARANARRSLVAARFIPKGKIIEAGDLTWKRPASGISPADIDKVLGRITVEDIKEDSSLKFEMFN
jgi:N-acetylneuraminate synthase